MLDIRNIGILAHVDAGKTTLTEQLLYLCGAVRQPGNVDEGTAQTDWLEVEKRRGISVKTACARLEYGGGVVQLIDTPGHVDFAGEVERSLAALDGAVLVLSAVEGVQAHTLLLWEALRRMDLPVLLVINKIDRAGSRVADVLDQIGRELTAACLPVQRAEGEGDAACAVLPRPFADPVFREEALLAAAEADPALEDAYLEGRPVDDETLEKALTRAARAGKLTPVLLASAKLGVGMRELMDGIVRFLPPADTRENTPLSGVVFAIEHDPVMGKAAHVRLFGGQLRNRDAVPVLGRSEMEKITQIRRISGSRATDAGVLRGGEIGALYGLPSIRAGDILGAQERRRPGRLAVPLLLVRAFPSCEEELSPLLDALRELSEEDPLLGLEWNREKREIYLRITGKIQLEILSERLAGRYRLHANFSAPSVIYKETPRRPRRGKRAVHHAQALLGLPDSADGAPSPRERHRLSLGHQGKRAALPVPASCGNQRPGNPRAGDSRLGGHRCGHHPDGRRASPDPYPSAGLFRRHAGGLPPRPDRLRIPSAGTLGAGAPDGWGSASRPGNRGYPRHAGGIRFPCRHPGYLHPGGRPAGGHLPGLSGDLPLPDLRQGQLFLPVCRIPRVPAGLRGGYAPPGRGSPGSRPLDPSRPQRDVSQTCDK